MNNPRKTPFAIEVKKGEKKSFCLCDSTNNPPFCDGTHNKEASGKKSIVVTFEEDKTVYICGCGQSNNRPFCDGTHNSL